MKHVGIEIKFYNLDTFKKQTDVNFIDLDSNLVDLNYKVASLIFCHFWRSILEKIVCLHYFDGLQIDIPACVMSSEYFTRISPYLVRLKIFE